LKKDKVPEIISIKGFLRFQILHELKKKRLCGDELAQIIGRKKKSKLTPGTIYPTLKYLRRKKMVKYKKKGRKKLYELTEKGEEEYKIARKSVKKIFRELFR